MTKQNTPQKYRGIYPDRIKTIASDGAGRMALESNAGCRIHISGWMTAGEMPKLGANIVHWEAVAKYAQVVAEIADVPQLARHYAFHHSNQIDHAQTLADPKGIYEFDATEHAIGMVMRLRDGVSRIEAGPVARAVSDMVKIWASDDTDGVFQEMEHAVSWARVAKATNNSGSPITKPVWEAMKADEAVALPLAAWRARRTPLGFLAPVTHIVPRATFHAFATAQEARTYRYENNTGGWIFDDANGAGAVLFPPDMSPHAILSHPLTQGWVGALISNA